MNFYPKQGNPEAPVRYTREKFIELHRENVSPHRLRVVRRYGVYASQGKAVRMREVPCACVGGSGSAEVGEERMEKAVGLPLSTEHG